MSNAIPAPTSYTAFTSASKAASPSQLDKLIFLGLAIYITTVAFEGPVRFLLSYLKIATLLYARDLISASIILTGLVLKRTNFERQKTQLQLLIYLLVTTLFATIFLGNAFFSGLFAIKIFAIFLFGLSAYTSILTYPKHFKYATVALFFITAAGVLVNKFYIYPWEGASFESAFGATDMSRVWWVAGGERRLAGLTRASPVAAGILGLTGVAMLITMKNYWLRLCVMFIGAAGIYLTTSKGLVLAYTGVASIALLPMGSSLRSLAGKSLATVFFLVGLLAPLISWVVNPGFGFFRSSPFLLSSFADRIANTWPATLNNFKHWYNWLIGEGLGGVGLPSLFSGRTADYTVVDNLHLFLMGNFGLIGSTLFVLFYIRIFKHAQNRRGVSNAAFTVAVMGLGYGIVTNIADDAFSPIAMGLAWGLLSQPEEAHATPD